MADASKGLIADSGPKTVGAFLTSWLEDSVRGSVRKSTYDRNESLCRVRIVPALGRKKLKIHPKIVLEMLGHASIAITLDTYSHVLPNMQDSAVTAIKEAFLS